jgi:hypothetical protein
MSIYVITGIAVVDGEVHHSVVAKVTKDPKTGVVGADMGRQVDRAELATLMDRDEVYTVQWDGPGTFTAGSRVRPKPGPMAFPMSVDEDGTPNGDLMNVARFNVGLDD